MIPFVAIGPSEQTPGDARESTSQQLLTLLQGLPTTLNSALESYRTNGVASTNDMEVAMGSAAQAATVSETIFDLVGDLPTSIDTRLTEQHGSGNWTDSGTESALLVSTTIATLTSQTSFTLTAGSADNDAYNRQLVVITDAATLTQKARGIVADYVGSTRTVTLASAPAFTIAVGDSISIIAIGGGSAVTLTLGATVPLTVGEVVGFTEPIVIGDDYTDDVGRRITITLTDTAGNAIPVEYGDHDLAVNCTIVALFHPEGKETVTTAISGECEYVAAVDDDPAYLLLTLPREETAKAVQGTYQVQIEARWTDGFNVTMAYKGTVKFTRDIRRR